MYVLCGGTRTSIHKIKNFLILHVSETKQENPKPTQECCLLLVKLHFSASVSAFDLLLICSCLILQKQSMLIDILPFRMRNFVTSCYCLIGACSKQWKVVQCERTPLKYFIDLRRT